MTALESLPLVSGWRLGVLLKPRIVRWWQVWRYVRARPGLFWLYDDTWGWLHLQPGLGGLCSLDRAIEEASRASVPFRAVSAHSGVELLNWRSL